MTKAITLAQALHVLNGIVKKSQVCLFVDYVNSVLSNKETMLRHRCSPTMGHFYQIGMNLHEVTPDDCLQIELAFRTAGWKDVQVVYWLGALSISLEVNHRRGWVSHYNGERIDAAAYGLGDVLPRPVTMAGACF